MSSVENPPLKTKESDGSVSLQPTYTLNFDSSDFNITKTGTEATITTSGSAGTIGGSITEGQVAFGAATADSIEGSSVFTYTTPSTFPTLTIGDSTIQDAGGNLKINCVDNLQLSTGSTYGSLKFYPATGTQNAFEIAYTGAITANQAGSVNGSFTIEGGSNATLFVSSAAQDNIGMGISPTSSIGGQVPRLHVLQEDNGIGLLIEDNQDDENVGPQLVMFRNSASPAADDILGRIRFEGDDSGGNPHTYSRITSQIRDPTDGAEYGRTLFENRANGQLYESMRFDGTSVIFNNSKNLYQDLTVWGDNDATIYSDAGNDNVTMGSTTSDSTVERLEVVGTGTGTLMRLTSTDADANSAPELSLWRNSATSATDDIVGQIRFEAETQSSGIKVTAATFYTRLKAVSGDAVDAEIFCDIRIGNASKNIMKLGNTEVVFNDDSADVDFRVESDDNADMFKIDANNNLLGVGAAPVTGGAQFQVDEDAAFLRPVLTKTATYTPMPDEEAYGHIFNMNNTTGGAIVLGLPPGVEGMHLSVILGGTDEVTLTPSGSEVLNAETGGNTLTLSTVLAKWDIICYRDAYWSVTRSVFAS